MANIGTIPKSNTKIADRGNTDTRIHKHTTTHFPGLVQALQQKVAGLNYF